MTLIHGSWTLTRIDLGRRGPRLRLSGTCHFPSQSFNVEIAPKTRQFLIKVDLLCGPIRGPVDLALRHPQDPWPQTGLPRPSLST